MCNSLHHNSTPIPISGIGYKIFLTIHGKPQLLSFMDQFVYNHKQGTAIWHECSEDIPYSGFCFFLTHAEAKRALNAWNKTSIQYYKHVIVKIIYNKGLGQHQEHNFVGGHAFTMAICGEFSVHPDELPNFNL